MKDLKKQMRMNFHIPEEEEIFCRKEDSLFLLLWEDVELLEDEIEEFLEEFKACSSEWKTESTRSLKRHVQVLRRRMNEISASLAEMEKEGKTRNLPL